MKHTIQLKGMSFSLLVIIIRSIKFNKGDEFLIIGHYYKKHRPTAGMSFSLL